MRKKKPTAKQVELFNTLKENLSFHDIDVPTDFLLFEEYLTNFINYNKKFGKPTDKQLDSVLKRWENRYGVKLFPSACTDREEISMLFKALEMTPSNGEDFIKIYREKRRTRLQDILIKTKNKEKLNFEEEWYFKNDLNYTFMNGYSLFCENREVDLVAPFDEDEYCDSLEGEVFVEIDNELFKHTDKYKELIAVYTTLGYLKETGFQRVFELNDIISLSGLSEFEVSNALKTLVTERFVSIEVFSSTIFYYNETIKPEKTITSIELKCVKNVLELYKNKELSKDAFETYIYLHSLATEDLETNGKYKSGDLSFVSEDIWNELIAANKVKRETNGDFNRISMN